MQTRVAAVPYMPQTVTSAEQFSFLAASHELVALSETILWHCLGPVIQMCLLLSGNVLAYTGA